MTHSMLPSEQTSQKTAVILVHGTWPYKHFKKNDEDNLYHLKNLKEDSTQDQVWFRHGHKEKYVEGIIELEDNIELFYFPWNGRLSFLERYKASNKLYSKILKMEKEYQTIIFIGHSHGGNVVLGMLKEALKGDICFLQKFYYIFISTPFIYSPSMQGISYNENWFKKYKRIEITKFVLIFFLVYAVLFNVLPSIPSIPNYFHMKYLSYCIIFIIIYYLIFFILAKKESKKTNKCFDRNTIEKFDYSLCFPFLTKDNCYIIYNKKDHVINSLKKVIPIICDPSKCIEEILKKRLFCILLIGVFLFFIKCMIVSYIILLIFIAACILTLVFSNSLYSLLMNGINIKYKIPKNIIILFKNTFNNIEKYNLTIKENVCFALYHSVFKNIDKNNLLKIIREILNKKGSA